MIGMTTGWRQHVYRRGFQFNHGLIRRLKSPVFVTKVMSFHPPFTRLMSNIHFGTNWWPCTPSIQRPLLKFVLQTKTQCLGLFSSNTVLKIVFSASAVATMFILYRLRSHKTLLVLGKCVSVGSEWPRPPLLYYDMKAKPMCLLITCVDIPPVWILKTT